MKTLGKIFLVLVFAAVVSGIYYWQVLKQPIPQIPSRTIVTTTTYNNDEFQFAVTYEKKYKLSTEDTQDFYFPSGGKTLATISIPSFLYPNTNLNQASATFSAKGKSTETDCQTYLTSANKNKKMTVTETLNHLTFFTDSFDGAAAGTKYNSKLYRILHNSHCYEINLKIGISNIQNYPEGTVSEIAVADIQPKLEDIVKTFKFTDAPVSPDVASGTLTGRVAIGPNCPVERSDQPCSPSPDAYDLTQIIVYSSNRSEIVAKAKLDQSGDYSVNLPVGIYYVTYTSSYRLIQPPMVKVTVMEDQTTIQDFSIDTGIR
ncbi:MAG: hypothetical protein KW802_00055 [Candidatus Doudnabacteria bacterium]|nr:hypothetical protein [Candidatus Doudnabacteria bacterium]